MRKGSRSLRAGLTEAAGRSRQTALGQQYLRLLPRLGPNKAAGAIARKLLILAYLLMRDGGIYHDPSPTHLPPHIHVRRRRRALHDLRTLGYDVTLSPVATSP